MRTFIILGEPPAKKNHRINTKTGKSFPSKRYTEWNKYAKEQLMLQKRGFYSERCKMLLKFYHGDYRERDSDNQVSSVFDTLVDAKYLKDDNWMIIGKYAVSNDYDKSNPRVEITILEPEEHVVIEI